jgi:cytochrome c553
MKIVLSVALAFFLFGCSEDTTTTQTKEKIVKHVNETSQKVQEQVEKTVDEVKETAQEVKEKTVEAVEATVEEVVAKVDVDGSKLYKTSCLSCHGLHAEKKALTKSQVIQGWESSKVLAALEGYKNKTYGNAMKTIMEGKVKDLSAEDMKALSDYISSL